MVSVHGIPLLKKFRSGKELNLQIPQEKVDDGKCECVTRMGVGSWKVPDQNGNAKGCVPAFESLSRRSVVLQTA